MIILERKVLLRVYSNIFGLINNGKRAEYSNEVMLTMLCNYVVFMQLYAFFDFLQMSNQRVLLPPLCGSCTITKQKNVEQVIKLT